jgi:two-component system CheB/CheR fusion protein
MQAIRSPHGTSQPSSDRKPATSRGPGEFLAVGIGASASGLDACSKLMDALPADGMALEPNRLYAISPGTYLSVAGGSLQTGA